MKQIAITASGLTMRFGSLVAVDSVDLEIEMGSIYGFLGPNGSGRSTTIRMLCGLLRPSSGSATVIGMDTKKESESLAVLSYSRRSLRQAFHSVSFPI